MILGPSHKDAQIVYVIPEDPLENIIQEKLSKMINHKNEEIKVYFKKFCEAQG